jgi:ribose 5-phosphate isomerase RpiB
MKIALASDHAGFELKTGIIAYLEERGIVCQDFGCGPGENVDYVDYGARAAGSVVMGECGRAILFCGTGIGMAVVAGVSRSHNDSNCLTLGGRTLSLEEAIPIVDAWLQTPFEGGRHARRVSKITAVEGQNFKD